MVTEIKMVPLDKVKDSPFRNKKRNPIDTDKVKHIAESVTATDFWKGIQGREVGGFVEVAFGHHRIDAARLLGMKEIPIEVLNLSDAEMLQRMTRENLRGDLPAALEVVEATIKAYAAGVVKLDTPNSKTRKDVIRYAPSYKMASSTAGVDHPYTADTLARFLGGVYLKPVDKTAQDSIPASLGILELEECGVAEQIEKSLHVNDVDPSGRYKSAKHVRRIVEETKERVVKVQERAEKTAKEIAAIEAKQKELRGKEAERKAKEKREHDELLNRQMAARVEENAAEAKRVAKLLKEQREAAEAKAERDKVNGAKLDADVEAKKKAAEEQRRVDEYSPIADEVDRVIHKLERRDMSEEIKALARRPMNTNDRERVRQAALNAGTWYSQDVADQFLPPVSAARKRPTQRISKEKK
jgi:hypothetical protein